MEKTVDRRVRKTKNQLRQGLARLMLKKKPEGNYGQGADRSGGYEPGDLLSPLPGHLRYGGQIEDTIMTEFQRIWTRFPMRSFPAPCCPLFSRIYAYLAENADLCAAFLGENERYHLPGAAQRAGS